MRLSIIVTHYRNPELLRVCLDSLIRNVSLPREEYEIIVSDSETQEETALMMREDYPDLIFLPARNNIGFSRTVNRGLGIAKGEHILILNGDIIAKKDSVEKLLDFVESHPDVGLAGPQLLNFNETPQLSTFRFYTPMTIIYRRTFLGKFPFAKNHLDQFAMKGVDKSKPVEVDWMMGSSLMTSRSALDKVGPMDERYKMYFEDTDWCRQFWEKGYKVVYFPDSKMYHYHGKGSASKNVLYSLLFNRLTWLHIGSAIKFFLKYRGKNIPKNE